MPFLEGESG